MPFGKRIFNDNMKSNFIKFINKIQSLNIEFINQDFFDFSINNLNENDFIYLDPPYLITEATYNTNWNEECEKKLYDTLDNINAKGINFILSNVIEHKGIKNEVLILWKKKYNYINIDRNYSNSYYRNKDVKSKEIIVFNY